MEFFSFKFASYKVAINEEIQIFKMELKISLKYVNRGDKIACSETWVDATNKRSIKKLNG